MHGMDKPDDVEFRVRSKNNAEEASYKIEMFYQERPYKFENLSLADDEMRFVLDTGDHYDCVLITTGDSDKEKIEECKSEQGYCGKCIHEVADERRKIIIDMLPPPTLSEAETNSDPQEE